MSGALIYLTARRPSLVPLLTTLPLCEATPVTMCTCAGMLAYQSGEWRHVETCIECYGTTGPCPTRYRHAVCGAPEPVQCAHPSCRADVELTATCAGDGRPPLVLRVLLGTGRRVRGEKAVAEVIEQCCDPVEREKAGHHAATCTDLSGYLADRPLALKVACPEPKGCGRPAGKKCVTAQGYSTPVHKIRVIVARGGTPTPVNKGARPSHNQADMLAAAIANGGIYLLCGYNFHGVDQLRRTMRACVTKQWFELREYGQHEDRYEITNAGRNAHARYQEWMDGGPK